MQYSSNARLAPSNFRGIVLLTTAESQASIHALLHTLHVFKDVTSIPPLRREARKDAGVAETSLRKKHVLILGAGMVALTYSLSTSQYAAAFGIRGTPSIRKTLVCFNHS
ncbi:hypothetical protein DEU56DRAFT_919253 [Suillus clintonianus]|uniref:uncharacterized protein n=1 Tax=Suillus clintonianus TaxID=1904413 RepID=UPI001B85B84F|nr:uncharacterized protein DEU56DRAFT_919253 [Suillus clintonianus]KAG2116274.1 hypothetical protein DEU56DRAFT_919253 [Suillus clintonianus]